MTDEQRLSGGKVGKWTARNEEKCKHGRTEEEGGLLERVFKLSTSDVGKDFYASGCS